MRARAIAVVVLGAVVPVPSARAEDPMREPGGKAVPARENRLAKERSPYLRQHARNPVDWWPWGPEALAEARARDKPIFLSIGYAACHWCHVMAHESFEDEETARAMNRAFVCVKVDREERPDLDDVYMAATQVTTGRGGWPLSLVLLPDGRPFLARTYLPPQAVRSVSAQIERLWREDRARIEAAAEEVTQAVRRVSAGAAPEAVSGSDADLLRGARERLAAEFDRERGGFDRAPKFPPHGALLFLLDRGGANAGEEGLAMARATLDGMAAGGVRDHLGGGFHRYSTDAEWLLPHFEKMLYDNALLARAYAEAHALGGEPRYARVARETLAWVVREMSVAGGGYASSLDADTEGEEGLTYVWTADEVRAALPEEDARFATLAYGVEPHGNFADEASGRRTGRNVLHLPRSLEALARAAGRPEAAVLADLDRVRARLLEARAKRPQPARDGKVIVAWNGLLLSAFARVGTVLREPAHLERARALAGFLLTACRDGDRLLRLPRDSGPRIKGFLDDHAHLADGLLDLAEATGEASWADEARRLAEAIRARFSDPAGGFHSSADDHESLLARPKDAFDSPIPSANATAARVFLRLSGRFGSPRDREACDAALAAFRPLLARAPTATLAFHRVLADRHALAAAGAVADKPDVVVRRATATVEAFLERGEARPGTSVRVLVRVTLAPGLHANPFAGVAEPLVATSLAAAPRSPVALEGVVPPPPALRPPGPGQPPMPLLEGAFEVRGVLAVPAGAPPGPRKVGLLLTFQPCDATSCRAPEELRLDLPLRFSAEDGPPLHPAIFR
jgi:uncharacterized protein YyaL (SSP411 family)